MKLNIKDTIFCVGVMMFLFGLLCLDSSLKIGTACCVTGVAIGFIGDKFFY